MTKTGHKCLTPDLAASTKAWLSSRRKHFRNQTIATSSRAFPAAPPPPPFSAVCFGGISATSDVAGATAQQQVPAEETGVRAP
eukprot:CAMPEP_0183483374 /NCGR_PEP_ID=MMETSP0370-20130417/178175_1 /TAXON_ID=268820 /ORGANISM="Peridinium aciculiferum, Strain PAER-2" /LENGTH=82 /DNA_ID=CAMNT_0025676627 /DNA_START=107 /DNA_END=355 /DNA_ORIENTATION=+